MEQNCPYCGRHCPASDPHCNRGREYFGVEAHGDRGGFDPHERGRGHDAHGDGPRAVQLLRECGRLLHHGRATGEDLIAPLTERELQTLERLLEKCLYAEKQ